MGEKESIIWFREREEIPPLCKLFWRELGTASLQHKTVDTRVELLVSLNQMMDSYSLTDTYG